jgi:hypothetical protein
MYGRVVCTVQVCATVHVGIVAIAAIESRQRSRLTPRRDSLPARWSGVPLVGF